jgi:hypothetical protein
MCPVLSFASIATTRLPHLADYVFADAPVHEKKRVCCLLVLNSVTDLARQPLQEPQTELKAQAGSRCCVFFFYPS